MRKYSCAIALVLSFVASAGAQHTLTFPLPNVTPVGPSIIPYLAGPPILPTSPKLQELGASSFQFIKLSKKRAVVALFDGSLRQIATVELKLNGGPRTATFLYTIYPTHGDKAWIKLEDSTDEESRIRERDCLNSQGGAHSGQFRFQGRN